MPDTAAMVAEVSVHETEVDKVRPGQPVQVVMDAFPDRILRGEVLEVAPLPDQQRGWMNPDLKVYKTLVSIDGTHDFLKTRMSCRVEILVRQLEDVLLVPIQVVANRGGQKVCYVKGSTGPQEREVRTGAFTDTLVQIIDGLQEGDEVLLNPPMFDDLSGQRAFDRSQNWETGAKIDTNTNAKQEESETEQNRSESSSNPMNERFKQMDTNSDGKISLSDEVPQQAKQFLTPLDVNKDGFIDKKEMTDAAKRVRDSLGGRGSGRRQRNRSETPRTSSEQ
jgi:HlyD family secretion protein